jgi:Periplasmic binding protein-like domain
VFVHKRHDGNRRLPALDELGMRVPADCSLVCRDDLSFAEHLEPALTTVRLQFQETDPASGAASPQSHSWPTGRPQPVAGGTWSSVHPLSPPDR